MFMWRIFKYIAGCQIDDLVPVWVAEVWGGIALVVFGCLALLEYAIEFLTYPLWRPLVWAIGKVEK